MSYLTTQTCLTLGEVLVEFARVEKQIEVIRQLLCEQPRFHPYIGFKIIDRIQGHSKGYLLSGDIKTFLYDNGFQHDDQQCKVFVNNYDQDGDGTIQYSEFLRAVLPLTNQGLRQEISLKQPQHSSQNLDTQSQYTLAKLIDQEITLTLELDHVKDQLQQCYDFAPSLCFQQFDRGSTGRILVSDLERFFYENAIIVYDDELIAMFKRLDIMNDGLIDREEFFRMISLNSSQPPSPFYQSPTKSSHYLQRYLGTQKQLQPQSSKLTFQQPRRDTKSAIAYDTPPKQYSPQHNQSRYSSRSPNKLQDYDFDDTMSNVMNVGQNKPNIKILKQYESPTKKEPVQVSRISRLSTSSNKPIKSIVPQKYIDQKTDLRGQLELSKLSSKKSTNRKPYQKKIVTKSLSKVLNPTTPQNKSSASTKANTDIKPIRMSMSFNTRESSQKKLNKNEEKRSSQKGSIQRDTPKKENAQRSHTNTHQISEANYEIYPNMSPKDELQQYPEFNPIQTFKPIQIGDGDGHQRYPKQSMDPHFYFAQILVDVLDVEKNLEEMKQQLAMRSDFNLYDAFRAMDINKYGYASGEQLDQFVGLRAGTMNLLVLKYGDNHSLRFSDFIRLILPKSRDLGDLMQSRKPISTPTHYNINQVFYPETLKLFKQTLLGCLEGEISLDKIREKISSYQYSNLKEAFQLIDMKTKDGQLNIEDIDTFLLNQQMDFSIEDLQLILRLLDYNGDGIVTMDDFVNKLTL